MSASVKSVFLSDFTSHAETRIELAPPGGLTMLAGKTAAGKSQIVRALRLLYYNVPDGDEYIRTGRSSATVAQEMDDGTKITRERSHGSINRYRIARPGAQAQVLEGFGRGVPVEVQELTGVRTVTIGESLDLALNLSEQLDGPFLGNKVVSGPARAKILGSLAGTEEVDRANTAVGDDIHKAQVERNQLADEVKDLDARITEYEYLPALAEQISALAGILTGVRENQSRLATMESLSSKTASIQAQRAQALAALARWGGLAAAVSHVEYASSALTKMQALSGHKSSLASIATQRAEWGGRLARWAGLEAGVVAHAEAEQAWHRMMKLAELKDDLAVTKAGIVKARAAATRWANIGAAEQVASGVSANLERLKTLESHNRLLTSLVPYRAKITADRDRWTNLDAAETASSACSQALGSLGSLQTLSLRLDVVVADRAVHSRTLGRWANLADAESASSSVQCLEDRFAALCSLRQATINIHNGRVLAEQNLSRQSKALSDAESLYLDTLIAIGTCPVCGSRVDPKSLSLHIKEVA